MPYKVILNVTRTPNFLTYEKNRLKIKFSERDTASEVQLEMSLGCSYLISYFT